MIMSMMVGTLQGQVACIALYFFIISIAAPAQCCLRHLGPGSSRLHEQWHGSHVQRVKQSMPSNILYLLVWQDLVTPILCKGGHGLAADRRCCFFQGMSLRGHHLIRKLVTVRCGGIAWCAPAPIMSIDDNSNIIACFCQEWMSQCIA